MKVQTLPKQEPADGGMATWRTSDLAEHFPVMSTLPADTPEMRVWIMSLIETNTKRGSDLIGQVIQIGDYVVHPVELISEETGEVVIARRIIFPQPDSPPVAFVSEGVLKSMNKLAWASGLNPPWDPPLSVRVKQRNTRKGRRWLYLELVP